MAYNDYEVVKLVTTIRPNLGFYSSTPDPPCWVRFRHLMWSISLLIRAVHIIGTSSRNVKRWKETKPVLHEKDKLAR